MEEGVYSVRILCLIFDVGIPFAGRTNQRPGGLLHVCRVCSVDWTQTGAARTRVGIVLLSVCCWVLLFAFGIDISVWQHSALHHLL